MALGRSRGGFGTQAVVTADSHGRAITFVLAPGQAYEMPLAHALLNALPDSPVWVVVSTRATRPIPQHASSAVHMAPTGTWACGLMASCVPCLG